MANEEILLDFIKESRDLIQQMHILLEEVEGDMSQAAKLADYGQYVDRIMGGARTLSAHLPNSPEMIQKIADYAAVCKAVGYKTSQITNNQNFFNICIALLMDATDVLYEIVELISSNSKVNLKEVISQTLIDRVNWVSNKFSSEISGTVASSVDKAPEGPKMSQNEIDELMSKLGL